LVRESSPEFTRRLPSCGDDSNFQGRSKGTRHAYLPSAELAKIRARRAASRGRTALVVDFFRADARMGGVGAQQGLVAGT